jgi:hypothetical protein
MAEAIILEFEGVGRSDYEAVNAALGLGSGKWDPADAPQGMIFHAGGAKPGGWVVFEVWESKADQERFMSERLGKALAEGGVDKPPSRAEWLDLARHEHI